MTTSNLKIYRWNPEALTKAPPEKQIELWNAMLARIDLFYDATNLFFNQDRLRGYPTGPEWMELIQRARTIIDSKGVGQT